MKTPSNNTQTFIDAVKQDIADTPYALETTNDGFKVEINLADTKWWMPLSRSGLQDAFTYEVKVYPETKQYSINDVRRRIEWQAGAEAGSLKPYFDLNYQYSSGSNALYHREITLGVSDEAKVGKVVDINFSSLPRKKAIREIAKKLGWKTKLSTNQKIGIGFGIGGGIFAVACVVIPLFFI